MDEARANDPMRNAMHTLIDVWREALKTNVGYTAADLVEIANTPPPGFDGTSAYPELHEVLIQQAGLPRGGIDVRRVGVWLRSICGRVHDGYRIEIVKESRAHGHRYALVPVKKVVRGGEGNEGFCTTLADFSREGGRKRKCEI